MKRSSVGEDPPAPASDPVAGRRTLRADEAPKWCTENSYVVTGWRPVTQNVARCFGSWTYAHNETVNIFSHLIPAVLAVVGNALIHMYLGTFYPDASPTDRLILHTYITASMICFGASAAYHTLLCHSKPYAEWWVRVDYVGILVQILGSFISGIYMGFYCEPELRHLHWSIIGGLSFLTGSIVMSPIDDRRWRFLRLSTFVATGFSAFAPIIHAATLFPYHQLDQQAGLRFYYLEGVFILSGVFFYATHLPEAWRPGKFDIVGASHQIFHVFVVLGAATHLFGLLSAYDWNYQNQRCLWQL